RIRHYFVDPRRATRLRTGIQRQSGFYKLDSGAGCYRNFLHPPSGWGIPFLPAAQTVGHFFSDTDIIPEPWKRESTFDIRYCAVEQQPTRRYDVRVRAAHGDVQTRTRGFNVTDGKWNRI